jgi:hypothetical protein
MLGRMVRPFHVGVLALAVHAGCNLGGPAFFISDDGMVAGQRLTVSVRDICADEGRGNTDPCLREAVTGLVRADIGPPFTIERTEVRHRMARILLHAERTGESMLSVTVLDEDGEEVQASRLITAHVPERVEFTPVCTSPTAEAPFLVPVDTLVTADWFLLAQNRVLRADGYFPFEAPGLVFEKPSEHRVAFTTPATLESITVTSPADPNLRVELQTFDVDSFQTLGFVPDSGQGPLRVGSSAGYKLQGELERTPCRPGLFPASVFVETPSSCILLSTAGPHVEVTSVSTVTNGRVRLWGRAPGLCRITARIQEGTVPPVTLEVPVSP